MPTYLLIIVIAAIALLLALRAATRGGARMLAEQKERIENASEATAKIVAVGKSSVIKPSGAFRVKLRLEIFPQDLRQPFQTTTVWEIEPARVGELAVGTTLSVKFDERDAAHVYPLATWAKFNFLYDKLRRATESGAVQIN